MTARSMECALTVSEGSASIVNFCCFRSCDLISSGSSWTPEASYSKVELHLAPLFTLSWEMSLAMSDSELRWRMFLLKVE